MDVTGARCGVAVVPHEDGMFASGSGTPKEILCMTLAVIDLARSYGLDDVLRRCVHEGIGLDSATVVAEQIYDIEGEADGD